MALDTISITSTYTTLFTNAVDNYDDLYTNDKIDAETYAQLVGQAASQLLELSASLVQNQEKLEADIDLTNTKIATETQNSLKTAEEVVLIKSQNAEILAETVRADDKNEIDIKATIAATEDQYGKIISLTQDVSSSTDTSTQHHNIVEKLKKDVEIADKDIAVKEADINSKIAQEGLYTRQTQGFDDNRKQKAIDKIMDTWSILFSASPTSTSLPLSLNTASNGSIDSAFLELTNLATN